MNIRKYLIPTVGAVAFVVGGLLSRNKAMEAAETLDEMFTKKKSAPSTEQ